MCTQHGNLHHLSVMVSRMTRFILRAHTGICVSHNHHRGKTTTTTTTKTSGELLRKNACEWTGRVEISKEEILCSRRSMRGYMLTYPRLKRKNEPLSSGFSTDGSFISVSSVPHCGVWKLWKHLQASCGCCICATEVLFALIWGS